MNRATTDADAALLQLYAGAAAGIKASIAVIQKFTWALYRVDIAAVLGEYMTAHNLASSNANACRGTIR